MQARLTSRTSREELLKAAHKNIRMAGKWLLMTIEYEWQHSKLGAHKGKLTVLTGNVVNVE